MGKAGAILLVIAAIALPSVGSAQQKRYKWTDEQGRIHSSDTPPPACAKRFVCSSDERLAVLESQIKLAEDYLVNLRKKLVTLQAEANNYKPFSPRNDAPQMPEDLARDMARTTASIALCEQNLARLRADHDALRQSVDDDSLRLPELI